MLQRTTRFKGLIANSTTTRTALVVNSSRPTCCSRFQQLVLNNVCPNVVMDIIVAWISSNTWITHISTRCCIVFNRPIWQVSAAILTINFHRLSVCQLIAASSTSHNKYCIIRILISFGRDCNILTNSASQSIVQIWVVSQLCGTICQKFIDYSIRQSIPIFV